MEISQILQETGDVFDKGRNRVSGGEPNISRSRAGDEALDNETRQPVERFLGEFTGLVKTLRSESKALLTMKRVVGDHTLYFAFVSRSACCLTPLSGP